MNDLIDRSTLLTVPNIRKVTEYDETGCGMTYLAVPVGAINAAPAIDAVPVVHARWIRDWPTFPGGLDWWRCSACKNGSTVGGETGPDIPYCFSCGAKMDGGVTDAAY